MGKFVIIFLIILCLLCSIKATIEVASAETEWKISNVVHIQSGGSSNLLKGPDKKMAILYVSPTSKNITDIMLLPGCYFPEEGQPIWNVGIQEDNNGTPSGTFLGNGTLENPKDEIWSEIQISPKVSVTKGKSYWIVIEYLSGPVPNKTDHWLGIYASYAPKDFMHDNIPLPYNYSGEDTSYNDNISYTTVRYYNGDSWGPDPNERNLAVFVVAFEDGTYHGQPYRHNYLSIFGEYMMGQHFVSHGKNRTVNKLEMPWCVFHTEDCLLRPSDSLYYYIMKNDEDGELITKGVFLTPDEVYVSGVGNGAGDRKWYNATFEEPITFEKDTAYFMYLASPNSIIDAHWGSDASNAFTSPYVPDFIIDPLALTSFDGTASYSQRTNNLDDPWVDNRVDRYCRDMSFRFGFENENVTKNVTSITIKSISQILAPNQPFTIDIRIEPRTPITGAQFDLLFNSSMLRADSVTEGNLLNQNGAGTLFNNGTINNSTGTVTDVYGSILGKSNVSSEGVMATISMTAGSDTGMAELTLSNVIVSDSSLNAAPITIGNATVLVDTAPVLSSIGSKSISETNVLNFAVDASDADGNDLTYSATGLPDGANVDPATGVFTWTPAPGQSGVYTVTFEVSDGYLSDSEDVLITVNPPNNVPVIDSFEPENGSSFNEKEEISISVSAFDLDGQFLNYIIKINGVTRSNAPSYIWETDYSSSGEHTVEVTVSDGIDQVTEQRTIYVIDYYPPWDVVEDGEVNILDIATVAQEIGTNTTEPDPRFDLTQDGLVDVLDLIFVGSHFGEKIE